MANSIGRICLLLASADVSFADLRAFGRWVERQGPENFIATLERLRDTANSMVMAGPMSPRSRSRFEGRANPYPPVSEKIEQLLVDEAGLTRARAAELLHAALERELGNVGTPIPDPGRTSFKAWVSRIAASYPENILLHVATKLRNEMIHVTRPDWPLKRDNE